MSLKLMVIGIIIPSVLLFSIASAQEGAFQTPDEKFIQAIVEFHQLGELSDDLSKIVEDYAREKMTREKEKLHEARNVIRWTNFSSKVGFAIAHVAVLLGFWVAISELLHARKLRKNGEKLDQQELRFGLEGIAVRTSLHGILLLMIAFGFYLVYLKFVFPIQVVGI